MHELWRLRARARIHTHRRRRSSPPPPPPEQPTNETVWRRIPATPGFPPPEPIGGGGGRTIFIPRLGAGWTIIPSATFTPNCSPHLLRMALIYTNGTTWHVGHGYLRSDHDDQIENLQPEDLSAEQPEHLSEEQSKDLTEEPPRRFEIRGHLVHGIPKKGDPNYEPLCGRCNPDLDGNDSVVDVTVSMASEQSSDDEDSAANPGGHNQNNEPVRAAPRRYMVNIFIFIELYVSLLLFILVFFTITAVL